MHLHIQRLVSNGQMYLLSIIQRGDEHDAVDGSNPDVSVAPQLRQGVQPFSCNSQVQLTTELLKRFNEHSCAWRGLQEALSTVDVLIAFAAFSAGAEGDTCRPVFLPEGITLASYRYSVLGFQGLVGRGQTSHTRVRGSICEAFETLCRFSGWCIW